MQRSPLKLGCSVAVAMLASASILPAQSTHTSGGYFPGGSVTGVIVDGEGVPQMGALVQLLLPDTTPAATVLTDVNGRYRVTDLRPGKYRVRVSAALFMPAMRSELQVGAGRHAIANITLSTLLAVGQWLPATRRTSDAADDDWMWTLRSAAARPVLRLAEDDTVAAISSSSRERRRTVSKGRLAVQTTDGAFAHGGTHQVLNLDRRTGDGGAVLRADFSGPRVPYPVAPSAEVSAGWQQHLPFGSSSRTVLTYVSHPELLNRKGDNGMQGMVLRNAQRVELGDLLQVDAGSVARAFNLDGNAVAVEPFLRVAYRPATGVVITYAFTAAQGTSQIEDLDRVAPTLPIAVSRDGHLRLTRGRSNSIALSVGTTKSGRVEVAAYRESLTNPMLFGVGVLSPADLRSQPVLVDPTTQSFVIASRDYSGTGVHLMAEQPITDQFVLSGEIADGTVLLQKDADPIGINGLGSHITSDTAVSATVRGRLRVAKTGTRAEAGYRWQRANTLTAVDSFRAQQDPAYLHCTLRQSLQHIPLLPSGLEAMVEVQNLLAQGYQPVVATDGSTFFLAQSPRMLQAGLSFTF